MPPSSPSSPLAHPNRHVYDTRPRQRLAWFAVTAVGVLGLIAMVRGLTVAGASADGTTPAGSTGAGTAETVATTTTAPPTALAPGLVAAFDRAAAAAAQAGHGLTITDGFRTAAQQQALFDAEVLERGSVEAAIRWVLPPDRSMHVRGLAIDVGDGPAADWLAAEGHRFGLCQTLAWEWWHFEWRAEWEADGDCPTPAQDP